MNSPRARSLAVAVLSLTSALLPLSVSAQVRPVTDPDSAAVRRPAVTMAATAARVDTLAGPRFARAGVSAPAAVSALAPQQASDSHLGAGPNVAMMGVGVAGVIIGSLVGGNGGSMIAIGGGVLGLIGLFRYLR
jgi:hypothetical protein